MLRLSQISVPISRAAAQLAAPAACSALQRLVGVGSTNTHQSSDTVLPSRSLAGSARLEQQPMPAAAEAVVNEVAKEEPRASYLL